jgi:class 3 adenylate cyclase
VESSSRTLVCSVLFLDIIEYSKKPVAEQLQLKQAFNRSLATALEQVPQRDRIILDTGDGAAVTFMGDPEDALFAALTVRNMASEVPVRLGVNLGPVRLVKDLNGQMNIIGDGINVAQRVMSFARPGQLLVSRSFYEVVSCLSRDYLNLFRHEGSRTDKHVREHEVYSVVGGTPTTRRLAHTESQMLARDGGWLAGSGPLGFRRSALVAAPLAFLLLVGGGVAARSMVDAAPASAAKARPARIAAAEKKPAAPEKAAPASHGRVELAVLPWGEVLIDGKSRGVSPPLRTLEIPPGSHTIELRNTTFPSHVEKVDVKAGEAVRIRHRFGQKK